MARSKSKSVQTTGQSPVSQSGEVRWLNYKLTSDDVPVVIEEAKDVPALCVRLAQCFIAGDDFSVRYNPARKNFSAYTISSTVADDGVRIGISAFAGSIPEAVSALLYKRDTYITNPDAFTSSGQSLGIG